MTWPIWSAMLKCWICSSNDKVRFTLKLMLLINIRIITSEFLNFCQLYGLKLIILPHRLSRVCIVVLLTIIIWAIYRKTLILCELFLRLILFIAWPWSTLLKVAHVPVAQMVLVTTRSLVYLKCNVLSPLFILELMPEFMLESFPALDNFMDRKWCFLSEIWVVDKSPPSPLQSFARGCWSAVLSSWLCLCVSCVLAVFSGFLNGSQDALWPWRGELNETHEMQPSEGYGHHWHLPQFISSAIAENVHISKHLSDSCISR